MDWFLYNNGLRHERVKDRIRPFSNSFFFKESKYMAAEKNLRVTKNFRKKSCPVITWNEKHLSKQKQVVLPFQTGEKVFRSSYTFGGL